MRNSADYSKKQITELEIQTKEVITKTLKAKGYDGVITNERQQKLVKTGTSLIVHAI